MRRVFTPALGAAVALACVALAVGCEEQSGSNGAETLRVGFREDAPPFSRVVEGGTGQGSETGFQTRYEGFSVDICRELIDGYLEVKPNTTIEFYGFTANTRFRVEDGEDRQFDLLCDPTSITVERFQYCSFSFPYFVTGISYVTVGRERALDDLAKMKVGIVGRTTAEARLRHEWKQRFDSDPDLVRFDNYADGIQKLSHGDVEGLFGDQVLLERATRDVSRNLFVSDQVYSIELYGFCTNPHRDPVLLQSVNRTLSELYGSGEIYEILSRHFDGRGASRILANLYRVFSVPTE